MGKMALRLSASCVLHAFLLCLVIVPALGSPTPTSAALKPRSSLMPDGSINCETDSSSDYYGLGVRLGVYLTWFTAWVANVSMPREIAAALDQNAIFLFALLLAMVRCAITGTLFQLDGLMLMHMCGGTIFGVISLWGYRTCVYNVEGPRGISRFGGFGTHMRLLLCVGVSSFGLFYWRYGVMGRLSPDTGLDGACEPVYTFMFTKVRAAGGIRIYYQIICIMCLIYFGIMLLVSSLAAIKRVRKVQWLMREKYLRTTSKLKFATGLNQKELRYVFYFLRIGNLVWMMFSIVMIEFTLNYNNVAGVLGENGHIFFPSQLIPMIIGIFSFLRILFFRYRDWRYTSYTKPSLQEDSADPKRRSSLPHSLNVLKVFTPETNVGAIGSPELTDHRREDKTAVDPLMQDQSRLCRYLVAWLPWLALYPWWQTSRVHQPDEAPGSPSSTLRGSPSPPRNEKPLQGHDSFEDSSSLAATLTPYGSHEDRRKSGTRPFFGDLRHKQVNTLV